LFSSTLYFNKYYLKKFSFIFSICFFLAACSGLDVFEKTAAIPAQAWYYNNKPLFSFTITDTLAAYNIFVVLRHTDAYRYNNIWLSIGSKAPADSMRYQNIDITLGTDAKGWEGQGMDDIFELRKNITAGPVPFKKPGTYTFSIAQIMRENPLKNILNVGIRVEKVQL
jgi:gliding motility-associated lipoprotein GldH